MKTFLIFFEVLNINIFIIFLRFWIQWISWFYEKCKNYFPKCWIWKL